MALTLNGSGTIGGLSAGGLPAATVTQTTLATPVAGNGPAFSAYNSTLQSLTAATFTKLQFQTEEWDTASCFDNTTNYRFTPNVAGYYQVFGRLQLTNFINQVALSIYKNGTSYKDLSNLSGTTSVFMGLGSALVYLNGSTDYIELYGYASVNSSTTVGAGITYFQASMIRSA